MFDNPGPRLFALPPGADFAREVLEGLRARVSGPEAMADVQIFVNTRRMQRRFQTLLAEGQAGLLPRIGVLDDVLTPRDMIGLPTELPPLHQKMTMARLVSSLLDHQPDLAPRSAVFDLADSLSSLLDEMQSEGVPPTALQQLDVGHLSEHWQTAQSFLQIATQIADQDNATPALRMRMGAKQLIARWADTPPRHPIIVAGSTGSRGTTAMLMEAVAKLPQGAVILPGFDFEQPDVWPALDNPQTGEDHPQFRFRSLMSRLDVQPQDIVHWTGAADPVRDRNRVLSMALRPAPITDQWLREGNQLPDLPGAMADVTLIEAASPRDEALAIALRLRQAIEEGKTAALITPDRVLTRQVTAALDRWGIEPDDSAGDPLHLTPPGRLLLQLAGLLVNGVAPDTLLALLKHPLVATSGDKRGPHLLHTRELELWLRRHGPAHLLAGTIRQWAETAGESSKEWAIWLEQCLFAHEKPTQNPLTEMLTQLSQSAELLCAGPDQPDSGALWDKTAGQTAQDVMQRLQDAAPIAEQVSGAEFLSLLRSVLSSEAALDPVLPHAGVMIWGTLEARVLGADLTILAGLNEGSWPGTPNPDPWLNREMRHRVGLLLPERRVGLAAHDFQQAAAAPTVVLSRAVRDAEAETVPSRWINRLCNLLNGLPERNGPDALKQMRQRGQALCNMAALLDVPTETIQPAVRVAPAPPVSSRPKKLSVTRIRTLIRDPYAIYAERILRLRPLDPLRAEPDAPLRGTVLHEVFEAFLKNHPDGSADDLMATAQRVLADQVPWPGTRHLWLGRLGRVADWFLENETRRRTEGRVIALETSGQITLPNGFDLTATADRIDADLGGALRIYDYKTGTPPTEKQIKSFDKQLLLEAVIAEAGGFADVARQKVRDVTYIGLGNSPKEVTNALENELVARTRAGLVDLIDRYALRAQGYAPRRAMAEQNAVSDYDHLSRYGEWALSDEAQHIEVGDEA
ncbi:hypothetical protein ACMU_01660 [Actibacterium mucosum KCTC 23349]|uniref:PD-(D/E)XK endonuclease-like domain-containing protein n=1 Tax=Actibacterium mucosum KCTC 23349 TaxID=1454373 RepID=A0A037ZL97_9RHOB|nr:double-strand break repair protein AddB [Actibacterium mucosum]KAJ57226.1 hypothetical protein ACMU_01660 [Actibacterium mucosum KCTC 23349]